ncbi:filamentous hemagglutinin N-terminal domain-containing protein [Anabaena sp. UHCC 0451]|uniref:two-partner secretion domain-containing protein n=1 Tax=Anabaena sp. UHCC 0451 TaxID=2055235 RepID=UPI002B21D2C2|nr:filamentous hemagglutinin N-terminal domain-containing protein [Anabaena sp. UHCC 0451]MEA5575683.1 filamentous hemagglutinin N-terminal domain-containing protein [Anabaena sp. UHCC 0451]
MNNKNINIEYLKFITYFLIVWLGNTTSVKAQIIPDQTLPQPSLVEQQSKTLSITGGTTAGVNLFHSFEQFSVLTGETAYFNNAANIQNILTRVTGNSLSNIDGLIRANGNANLFLINPNGIIFGNHAALDIGGSFHATTADKIKFFDGSEYSSINPQQPPLLTINLTPGLQYGTSKPGATIVQNGNLTTTKDLELVADKLDLQGKFQVGRDLTLQAQYTVLVRDTATNPFIANAHRDIIIQGNKSIDISSLNHPESELISGRDMIFISPIRILSNARYTTGGYFTTAELDGSLVDFLIPHERVIKATGDITLEDYTGSSLYILAGGKVQLGNVTINGNDNGIVSKLISDGKGGNQTVTVNAKNDVGIFDVRNGIDLQKIPKDLLDNSISFSEVNPIFSNQTNPNSADIIIGKLFNIDFDEKSITNYGGLIVLTNEYQPNPNLLPQFANIRVGNIDTGFGNGTNVSDVTITAKGNIETQNIFTYLYSDVGIERNGGNITLTAGGNIHSKLLDSTSSSYLGTVGNGGDITLNALGNIHTEFISSFSNSYLGTSQNGGNIILNAGGNILTELLDSGSRGGNGGNIHLNAGGNIETKNIFSNSVGIFSGVGSSTGGNAGFININAGGNIKTENIFSVTLYTNGNFGNGGDITLISGGNIETKKINSDSSDSGDGNTGNGGNITLISGRDIKTTSLNSVSSAVNGNTGNGGNITLKSGGDIETIGLDSYTFSATGNTGNAGDITLELSTGKISIPYFNSSTEGKGGNGGTITISADELNLNNTIIKSDATVNGGKIALQAPTIKLANTDISSTSFGNGNSGEIFLISAGDIFLDDSRLFTTLEPGSTGMGSDIQIQARNLNLTNFSLIDTGTYSSGNAGNVNIKAEDISLEAGSSIRSLTTGKGNAGNIVLDVNRAISLKNVSSISTAATATASGNSGDINVSSHRLSLGEGSQLQALTQGTGKSGDIALNITDEVEVSGISADGLLSGIFTSSEGINSGIGGKIEVDTNKLSLRNGGVFSAQTFSQSDGGNIIINANTVNLINGGQLLTSTFGAGKAGEINVNATNSINIKGIDANFANRSQPAKLLRQNVDVKDYDGSAFWEFPQIKPSFQISQIEPNNSITKSQNLEDRQFLINSSQKPNPNVEFSTRVPYVSIGARGNGSVDVYAFKVNAGTRGVFDIDDTGFAFDEQFNSLAGTDTKLTLFNSQGQVLASNDNTSAALGAKGSDTFLTLQQDPYFRYTFTQTGTYYIQVSNFDGRGISKLGKNNVPSHYDLQVSLETPPIQASTSNGGANSGIFANTSSTGKAGNITLKTSQIELKNQGSLSVQATNGGIAGNLDITTQELNLTDNSKITVSSPLGKAGNLTIRADNLFLNQSKLTAETGLGDSGDNANIRLSLQDLLFMENQSQISAQAFNNANGGNINIEAGFVITNPFSNSDIIANAVAGMGGNINITTQSMFGLTANQMLTPLSDISVSSQLGVDGVIIINTMNVDPKSGLIELPNNLIDATKQIAQTCQPRNRINSFIVTGRGGLPPTPREALDTSSGWIDWRINEKIDREITQNQEKTSPQIQEATGWIISPEGKVTLVAVNEDNLQSSASGNCP